MTGAGMPDGGAEIALAEAIAATYARPRDYVELAFPWGEGALAGHAGPDAWQTELLDSIGAAVEAEGDRDALRFAVASGHGVGKSALAAWIILWALSTRPQLAGVVTANTATQLRTKTWRELAIWHERAINGHWFLRRANRICQRDHPETWFVAAVPWRAERPEAFAGLHGKEVLMLYDEASAIDDAIWEVSEGAMTMPGALWLAFGNPTRNSGRFKDCFGRLRHRWTTRQVDSRTARMANRALVQQWIEDYGEDSDFVRVRARGVFPRAGTRQFIDLETIEMAVRRGRADAEHAGGGIGPRVLGVDVARFGDDQTVLLLRDGLKAEAPRRFRGLDTMQTAARTAEAIDRLCPDAIFVDGAGVGGGVVDRLKQLGFRVVEVNGGARAADAAAYANLRAEMWGRLRDWLERGARLPDDRELIDDLSGPEYGFDAANRIQLERKADMKRRGLASPDSGDALALTFAAPVAAGRRVRRRAELAVSDYDMFPR